MMSRILITGASGFAGRHLAAYLHQLGCQVYGLNRLPAGVEHVVELEGDLAVPEAASQAVQASAPDYVFHLAARTPANTAAVDDRNWLLENPLATLNLLEAIRRYYPQARTLLVSSSAIYGHISQGKLPISEEAPLRPTTMYGVSKATQELLAMRYVAEYGLHIVRARPFNLVGPGEPRRMLTSALASQVADIAGGRAEPVLRMRHRATSRDFTDIRDAVRAYWALAELGRPDEVYNVCSGVATPIGELVDGLLAAAGVTARVEETAPRPAANDIIAQWGRNQRITEATGWRPEIDLATSLRDLLESFPNAD